MSKTLQEILGDDGMSTILADVMAQEKKLLSSFMIPANLMGPADTGTARPSLMVMSSTPHARDHANWYKKMVLGQHETRAMPMDFDTDWTPPMGDKHAIQIELVTDDDCPEDLVILSADRRHLVKTEDGFCYE